MTQPTFRAEVLPKNARMNRSDIAWKHEIAVDGTRKIQCKYCQKGVSGGAYRLKHHLSGTKKDVKPCIVVSDELKKGNEQPKVGEKGEKMKTYSKGMGLALKSPSLGIKYEANQAITSYFYNNVISFNVAKSDEYFEMFELVAKHGPGFKPPSYHEIRVKYLKEEVKLTNAWLEEHKVEWKKIGCTIMTDGWTDKRRRTILNFLVHSPKRTLLRRLGENNVVQVVTDNASNYKVAQKMLVEKRKKLYWTPCAAHCIDLMLEEFEKKIPIHADTVYKGRKITTFIYARTSLISLLQQHTNERDLVRPILTRFATSYLTLGCLNDNRTSLIRMTHDGRLIENVVLDKEFWKSICFEMCISIDLDDYEKPLMRLIYEAMDQAKENIQSAYNSLEDSYMPLWKIIDDRWDKQLYRPLHVVGYFLNPQLHYAPGFTVDLEVRNGLFDAIRRMVPDIQDQSKIVVQMDRFTNKRAIDFGNGELEDSNRLVDFFGDERPELKRFALRVLSLTCSSSGCERKWSSFVMVHIKRRNKLKQETMNDVIFFMPNSKLSKKKQARKGVELIIDDIPSDDEWIVEYNNEDEDHLDGPEVTEMI
ncbi:hypothetical protein Lal_00035303 [Lupinus albus]|nr:hypothetical protein Lal_00035303 [Lupinus albus]